MLSHLQQAMHDLSPDIILMLLEKRGGQQHEGAPCYIVIGGDTLAFKWSQNKAVVVIEKALWGLPTTGSRC